MSTCPFCGSDPFHYVDNGIGMEAVVVVCCELGDLYFRGARPEITADVVIDPDTFRAIGQRISAMQHELRTYVDTFGDLPEPAEAVA